MSGSLVVVKPGPLSLIQDLGRPGRASIGVGRSGAADRAASAFANRLVGNPAAAALVETTFGGLAVRAEADLLIAVAGAPCPLTIDGEPAGHESVLSVAAGQVVALRTPSAGLRSYLAVHGGIDVPQVLGSRSTDTLAGLGPEPLRRGDVLPIGIAPSEARRLEAPPRRTVAAAGDDVILRVLLGPRDDWFIDPAGLAVGCWVVSPQSNRVGLRLDRPTGPAGAPTPLLRRNNSRELPSEGVVPGAIQVPPSGQPVLFLADHPMTGGYPVVAVVLDADVDFAAQARPGQRLRFRLVTPADLT